MYYPARFDKEDSGYTVTFRGIPEAVTCGDDFNDALSMAEDVLISAIEVYFNGDKRFPAPNDTLESDERWVFLPDHIYAKVLLHNTMLEMNVSKAELARLSNIRPPEIQRILTPRHATKIDTISRLLKCLNKRLHLSLSSDEHSDN